MLTVQYAIDNKIPVDRVLTKEEKDAIILENKDKDISYVSLLNEMFFYSHITMRDVLHGWSGIKLVTIKKK